MNIIASYPRSGSTYFRFILCNLIAEGNHDFNSVNKLIPTIESDEEMRDSTPIFLKTHELRNNVSCFLFRHVKDVLVSEYFYQKNFYGETKNIYEWIIGNGYGENWRKFINFYIGAYSISYENLINDTENTVMAYLHHISYPVENRLKEAIEKSSKEKVSKMLPGFIRKDNFSLPAEMINSINDYNHRELKLLGYAS